MTETTERNSRRAQLDATMEMLVERARRRAEAVAEKAITLARRLQALLGGEEDGYHLKSVEIVPDGFQVAITVGKKGAQWNFVAHFGVFESSWSFEIAHQLAMIAFRNDEAMRDLTGLIDSPKSAPDPAPVQAKPEDKEQSPGIVEELLFRTDREEPKS